MNNAEFQLRGIGDPRLAVHATSALPAWLWSTDGTRILWANPVGARLFGAANGAILARKLFGPADQHRRQVAQLAGRLPADGAIRLERLRGFGAPLGALVTCGCARLEFADGNHGILVAAAEPVGRAMPLVERLQRLVEGIDSPIAAFARDGMFVGASDAARPLLGFRNLSEAGLDEARSDALKQGRVETPVGIGHMVLQRVGSGADIGLVALIAPTVTPAAPEAASVEPAPDAEQPVAPPGEVPLPDYERPAISGEAPAEFALIDEFAMEPPAELVATAPAEPVQRPIAPPAEWTTPGYEQPAASGEAPAEFALIGEFGPSAPDERPEAAAAETAPQTVAPPGDLPTPDYEQPAISGEAPAEFTLLDEFEGPSAETDAEPTPPGEPSEPDLQSVLQLDMPFVEASHAEPPAETATPDLEIRGQEPSPYIEAVADEPAAPTVTPEPVKPPSWLDEPTPGTRRHPLRFMWHMDAEGRFVLGSDEFSRLIGARTAAGFGRLWSEIAETFGLDPDGRVAKAVATGSTWSSITLNWPVDGGGRLPVELSGLPIYDHNGKLAGYRGFGVCRDLDGLTRLAALRRYEFFSAPAAPQALSADIVEPDRAKDRPESHEPMADETSQRTDLETPVETPIETLKNVLPFRPISDSKSPVLTPVENSAFNELARQLSARLESEHGAAAAPGVSGASDDVVEPPAATETRVPPGEAPEWLAQPEPPARGETRRDRALLDLLPVGVLIYRLDRLLYANRAFLERIGYDSLHALEEAGGLDALYVEPGVSSASSTSDTGTPVTISASEDSSGRAPMAATDARLYTISWDDDSALALICSGAPAEAAAVAAAIAPAVASSEPSAVGHANAEELGAILDTTAEGIVMFDAEGNLNSCNRSAEALFGYDGEALVQRNLAELFAPESQRVVQDYLESIKGAGVASLLDHGRDALARVRGGGIIPVSMTMGRTRPEGPNFFAVFRDLSQTKKSESELQQARRLADRAANARADMLARISHEVRTPLNAIIGFAEVMIGERFGSLGNERYVEYMKDIRASGERVIAIINDLLDLSRIETGKLDLAFTNQNLNELVESCVAVMQPQANRERIIIRTSLAHALPPVVADARALRQITLNLIGNSIHLANAGGQVIVSTALSDFGEVVLRVRDTGHGLNDNEVAAAMEPFRNHAPSDRTSDSGVSLSLTKALVEANRAQFHIKPGAHSGTLIEVVFSHDMAKA
ncbi:PAS domain S-box protein [Bradyrhizobium sediminis]|uniref:histidine kinase n=1 Tax=Bradyrhizobium sediminis TaxID=2840469 RepID=A0A975NSW1_9BRAD|nr:PAS domain-containing protein [Bradyrhizobium sediminis]QWG20747.1 PAS domain S-box protein [Bradyrhizobium sediminis]